MQAFYNLMDEASYKLHTDADINLDSDIFESIDYVSYGLTIEEALLIWKLYKMDHPIYYGFSNNISYNSRNLHLRTDPEYRSGANRVKLNAFVYDSIKKYTAQCRNESSAYASERRDCDHFEMRELTTVEHAEQELAVLIALWCDVADPKAM